MSTRIKTFDFSLIAIPLILLAGGLAVIYSLVVANGGDNLALKQGIIGLIGVAVAFAITFIDYRIFKGTAWIFYLISILLLLLVEVGGKVVNGAGNWLDFKFFQLQPSELAKVFLILTMAAFLGTRIGKLRWKDIIWSVVFLLIPLGLVLNEPDLGTGLVIVAIFIAMLIAAKPTKSQYAVAASMLAIILAVAILAYVDVKPFGQLLHKYQRARIAVFLDPNLAPLEEGYNVKQAQITIGSGGYFGKGLGRGNQSQLQFLPEPYSDFIFAGLVESFGFVGGLTLLGLFAIFIFRMLAIARTARDNFGYLIVIGIAMMFATQAIVNIGMNLGVLPVVGIPLPFVSYGGTSLLISFFAVGLLESIYIRHEKISF